MPFRVRLPIDSDHLLPTKKHNGTFRSKLDSSLLKDLGNRSKPDPPLTKDLGNRSKPDPPLTKDLGFGSIRSKPDRTKDNDKFVIMLKGWIDQFALSMTNSDTKNYIQQLLIEPFMEYIFQRTFPYAIIAICIFLSIFIIVIIIFVLLLLNRNKCSICERVLQHV
jgi:hypothetical protein